VSTRSVLHDKSNSWCVSPSSDKAVSAWILLVLIDSKIENGVLLDTLNSLVTVSEWRANQNLAHRVLLATVAIDLRSF